MRSDTTPARRDVVALFCFDWDCVGYEGLAARWRVRTEGFDLFSFPSNVQLTFFDLERFAARVAARYRGRVHGVIFEQRAVRRARGGARRRASRPARHAPGGDRALPAQGGDARAARGRRARGQPAFVRARLRVRRAGARRPSLSAVRQAGEGGVLGAGAKSRHARRTAGTHPVRAARDLDHSPPGRTLRSGRHAAVRARAERAPHAVRAALRSGAVQPRRLRVRRPRDHAGRGRRDHVPGHERISSLCVPVAARRVGASARTGGGVAIPRGRRLSPRHVQHGVLLRRGERCAQGDRVQPAPGVATGRPLPAGGRRGPARDLARARLRRRPCARTQSAGARRVCGELRLSRFRRARAGAACARPAALAR